MGSGAAYLDGSAGTRRGRGSGSRHRPRRRRVALGCTRLRPAASGRKWCQACPSPAARRRGARSAVLRIDCKRGAWLETHREKHMENPSDSGLLCPTHRVCASFPLTFPLYTIPLQKNISFYSGKCASPSHAFPTCAVHPLLSGASPGELTLMCHLISG